MRQILIDKLVREIKPVILIDNGHGIETPGKRSPFSDMPLREYKFNRHIAQGLYHRLISHGIEAHLVVKEEKDISLPVRCMRINGLVDYYRNLNFFAFGISIHANAGGGSGFEVWTSRGNTEADPIATIFYNAFLKYTPFKGRADMMDGDPDKESSFYILKHTKCPMILTESGFMDNRSDLSELTTPEGRIGIINAHFQAVLNTLYAKSKNYSNVRR